MLKNEGFFHIECQRIGNNYDEMVIFLQGTIHRRLLVDSTFETLQNMLKDMHSRQNEETD